MQECTLRASIGPQPESDTKLAEPDFSHRDGRNAHVEDTYAATSGQPMPTKKFLQSGAALGTGLLAAGIFEAVLQPTMLAWSHRMIRNCARIACASSDPATVAGCLMTWQGVRPSAFNHPIGPPGHTDDGLCDNGSNPVQYGCVLGGLLGGLAFFGIGALLGYTVIASRIANTIGNAKSHSKQVAA